MSFWGQRNSWCLLIKLSFSCSVFCNWLKWFFSFGLSSFLLFSLFYLFAFFQINVDHFIEILKSFKPDIAQCLCDTVPSGENCKRNRKSVDRTLKFLDELLECRKNSDMLKSIEILGSVEGGDSETERVRCAVETSKRDVAGKTIRKLFKEIIERSKIRWKFKWEIQSSHQVMISPF